MLSHNISLGIAQVSISHGQYTKTSSEDIFQCVCTSDTCMNQHRLKCKLLLLLYRVPMFVFRTWRCARRRHLPSCRPHHRTIMEKRAPARLTLRPSAYRSKDFSAQRPYEPLKPSPPPDVPSPPHVQSPPLSIPRGWGGTVTSSTQKRSRIVVDMCCALPHCHCCPSTVHIVTGHFQLHIYSWIRIAQPCSHPEQM